MSPDSSALIEIVREAGRVEIVPRYRHLAAGDIDEKASAIDLVTKADLGAERFITEALLARYPHALIVGEEAYAANPAIVDGLAEAELGFVIDPVDGTFNFAAGNPMFGTILAVTRRGETIAGLLCDPLRGDVIAAEKGAGATLILADQTSRRVRVAAPVPLDQMVAAMTWTYLEPPLRRQIGANLSKVKLQLGYGCSAYDYWMAATGRVHFSGHQHLNPWDHLAGVLIHGEAGGYGAKFDGTPYRPADRTGGILVAPDRESWALVRREIIGDV